jgi:DNA transformation protein and related proteins
MAPVRATIRAFGFPSLAMPPKPLPEIVTHALELFGALPGLRVRPMFGGWGFYSEDVFFALVAFDSLYLKADSTSQTHFETAGSQPFRYTYPDGRTLTMGYWTAPEEAQESPAAMLPWARRALECALRARKASPKKA